MRTLFTLAFLIAFAGGASAQRGGGPSADDSFNRLVTGYGGSGDVLDYSKVTPESRERFNRFAQFSNSPPMPTSGTVTRAEYAEGFNKRMEAMKAGGGMRGAPPAAAQPNVTVTAGAAPAPSQERLASDDDVMKSMRRYDKNDDGKISFEEAQSSDRLRPLFTHYDANKDGFLDVAEMKVYTLDRLNNREPGREQQGQNMPPLAANGQSFYDQGRDVRDRLAPVEEPLPTVLRYGKLPMKELPSWFETLDTDKDGQIGLYEWREAKKATAEFLTMDLNADGLLTADEYLRWKKAPTLAASTSAMSALAAGKDGKESKDSRKDDKKGNAFRR